MDLYNAEPFKNGLHSFFRIIMLQKLPHILPVPNMLYHLQLKIAPGGVTYLKDGRFKRRYTGSRTSCVDINGVLYPNAGDLKKKLAAEREEKDPKKRKPGKNPARAAFSKSLDYEDTTILPTPVDKIKPEREYRVNKVEVRNRLLAMINTQQGGKELYFWTVTFPKGTSDDMGYKLLNLWLTHLRTKKWLRNYLWVAERQENGTVHFHIAIPHKLSVVHANRIMRQSLITCAEKGLIPFNKWQCKKYNGIDIAKNRKTKRVTNFAIKKGSRALANYLTKYVTKNNQPFKHLAWHNSRGFSSLFTGLTMTVQEFDKLNLRDVMLHRAVIDNEFFSYYPWRDKPPDKVMNHLRDLNSFLLDRLQKW